MTFDDRPDPAKRLRRAREAAGFKTGRAAASRFGWVEDTYTQHERGLRGIGRSADRYAKAFGVSEAWLLTGEGVGPKADPVSQETAELSRLYTDLPDEQRHQLLANARLLHDAFGKPPAPAKEARGGARKVAP